MGIKQSIFEDEALDHLRHARAFLKSQQESGLNSREIAVTITNIDSAILWRQFDLQIKQLPKDLEE